MKSLFRVIKADYLYLSPPRVIVSPKKDKKDKDKNNGHHQTEVIIAETELMDQQLLNEAREKAEKIISDAQMEAEMIIDNAQKKVCELEQRAQQEGYESGFLSGKNELAGERERLYAEINRQKESLIKERNVLIDQLEPEIIQLAVIIAKCIIHTELKIAPEQIKSIAKAVLDKAQGDGELILKVSSQDYDAISSLIEKDAALETQIKVEADNAQTMGCRLETPFGEIDASIDGQLQEVAYELLEVSKK